MQEETNMIRSLKYALWVIHAAPVGVALAIFAAGAASAQEKCKMSWDTPAADTKYGQQLALDVGDVPGHQVRVFEIHRVYTNDKPNCEGLKRVEQWSRLYSDYVDRNGRVWGYDVTTLENGDKIFDEFSGLSQTVVAPDGAKKSTNEGMATFTGGTGKYLGVLGIEWVHTIFDLSKGMNQTQSEVEYWFDK
jgi:hypothetical protein